MRKLLLAAMALGLALSAAPSANATLQLSLNINGAVFSCVDNAACDTNAAIGTINTGNQTFNGVSFLGSSQTQLTGGINELTTTSFQITNNNAVGVTYQLAVSGTNFVGPVTGISASGSGTFTNAIGSNIDLTYWASAANTQGANNPTDLPGTKLADSGLITATTLSSSIDFNPPLSPFSAAGLYSMSMGSTGTLVAGGQLTGRAQSEIAVNAVEPASLALLGVGMLGLGLAKRRRSHDVGGLPA